MGAGMDESIRNKYDVMVAASRRIREIADTITLGGTDFPSAAALEDAVPPPTGEQAVTDPLETVHMQIATQVRRPYRSASGAVDRFIKAAGEAAEELSVNVKRSADEYLAREERAAQGFVRLRGELGEPPR
ncbi:hypothetical protein GCM10025787_14990 [Saccharopolyspora rosea]